MQPRAIPRLRRVIFLRGTGAPKLSSNAPIEWSYCRRTSLRLFKAVVAQTDHLRSC